MPSNNHPLSVLIPENQAKAFKSISLVKTDQQADAWQAKIMHHLSDIKESVDQYINALLPDSTIESIDIEICDIQTVNDWSHHNDAYLFSLPFQNECIYAWLKKSDVSVLSSVSLGGPIEVPAKPSKMGRIEHKVILGLLQAVVSRCNGVVASNKNAKGNSAVNSELSLLEDRLFFSDVIPLQVIATLGECLLEVFFLLPATLQSFNDEMTIEPCNLYRPDFEENLTFDANVTMAQHSCTYQQLQNWTKGELIFFDFLEKMPLSIKGNVCGSGHVTEDKGQLVFKFEC